MIMFSEDLSFRRSSRKCRSGVGALINVSVTQEASPPAGSYRLLVGLLADFGLTDEKVAATVAKFLKNTKLTLENLASERARVGEAGGDASKVAARVAAAETELAILSSYSPKQMTEAELRAAIDAFRAANPDANVGAIMAHLKASFGGQYDGKAASALARG